MRTGWLGWPKWPGSLLSLVSLLDEPGAVSLRGRSSCRWSPSPDSIWLRLTCPPALADVAASLCWSNHSLCLERLRLEDTLMPTALAGLRRLARPSASIMFRGATSVCANPPATRSGATAQYAWPRQRQLQGLLGPT